jgi:hypothetical protein
VGRPALGNSFAEYTGREPYLGKQGALLESADFTGWELLNLKAHREIEIELDNLSERFRTSFQRLNDYPGETTRDI